MTGKENERIIIAGGHLMCERQYAQYRYNKGVDDTMQWQSNTVTRLNELAGDDKAFRLMVLAEFNVGV